ncbi:MAG: B12-binding domain-containing radical SAM protein [Bacteroidales bacterium]|nr:B12-binding domain-containing radical SAM protein [Bacteroidales bacterium]
MKISTDVLFLDGLDPRFDKKYNSFLGYLFPISSVLEIYNYSFKILNITFLTDYSYKGIIASLKEVDPKVICMTTTADNISTVCTLVNKIKKEFPSIKIVLGGPQATFFDMKIMDACKCDVIVRGEGEYKLLKLLDFYIKGKGDLSNIEGITYKINDAIIKTDNDTTYIDLNELPIPQFAITSDKKYWILPNDKSQNEIDYFFDIIKHNNNVLITSRGCPYNCIFCVEGNLERSYRERSPENFAKDLEYFIESNGFNHVLIADSTFTSSPKRVNELCEVIKKVREKYNFRWFAEGRANILSKNLDLIRIMHDAGMFNLQIGVESGSEKILEIQNKKITKKQIKDVAKEVGKFNDLLLSCNFILGNPGETNETFQESISFSKELYELTNYNIVCQGGYLVPYVGTPIRDYPEKYEIEILVEDFEFKKILGYNQVICKPNNINLEELENHLSVFSSEMNAFFKSQVFNKSKAFIDQKVLFYRKFSQEQMVSNTSPWALNFISLNILQRYYSIFESTGTIKDASELSINNLYPLRLWDLNFDPNTLIYQFTNLKGENIIIDDFEKYLWESAIGKWTIIEIIQSKECLLEYNDELLSKTLNFYNKMYDNFALIFREY